MQVQEYGLAVMCASFRCLTCMDAQHMLGLCGPEALQQLLDLVDSLSSR